MRFSASIFGKLLEPIDRRRFTAIVERPGGDAYDKSFRSWDHLVALIYAQLSGLDSSRALEAGWNADSRRRRHLGGAPLSRSTLADANRRRLVAELEQTPNRRRTPSPAPERRFYLHTRQRVGDPVDGLTVIPQVADERGQGDRFAP
jgi:hypothetical protein